MPLIPLYCWSVSYQGPLTVLIETTPATCTLCIVARTLKSRHALSSSFLLLGREFCNLVAKTSFESLFNVNVISPFPNAPRRTGMNPSMKHTDHAIAIICTTFGQERVHVVRLIRLVLDSVYLFSMWNLLI